MRVTDGAWLLTMVLLAGLCGAAIGPAYMNHDAAWYLHMSGVWLDGGALYRDVVDTNPPLIVFLSAVPVEIGRLLGASQPAVFKACVYAAAGASALLAVPLVRRTWQTQTSRYLVLTALAFSLFPFVQEDFGQREHLTVIFAAPFVFDACAAAIGRPSAPWASAGLGVLAGLGFAMKPHFAAAWFAIELCLAFVRREGARVRPAAVAVAATLVAYIAVVAVFEPDYFTVARHVAEVYGGLNRSAATLLRLPELRYWMLALFVVLAVRLPWLPRASALLLFSAATGFLVAALAQMKGWGYHLYPFRAFAVCLFASVVAGVVDAYPGILRLIRGGRRTLSAAAAGAVLFWSARYAIESRKPSPTDYVTPLIDTIEREHADSLALLSMRTILYPAFPAATYTNATWVLRHNSLWFLPGLYAADIDSGQGDISFRRTDAMPPLEREYFDQVVADLCAHPPGLLVIEPPIPNAPAGRRSLDLIRYYGQDPRFERLIRSYAPVGTIGPFVAYAAAQGASCGPHM